MISAAVIEVTEQTPIGDAASQQRSQQSGRDQGRNAAHIA
jgi:hypothetical protein